MYVEIFMASTIEQDSGQFYDLQALKKEGGEIQSKKYIFIGDFVVRGYNSVETMEYLLCGQLHISQISWQS
ncbi:unnamed protein product [Paramecium sonneborni]|uniref:Uncharacterized protein n=1 Tax=Paramecium sonneborni TaxID=65129 RepID=A0A8S1KHK4_9CILI|nr:unnamed protein product [Paramecium sonneborni]